MSEATGLQEGFVKKYWQWIVLGLLLVFIAGVRIRLLDFPLERDEGEYAYMGQQILEGIPPYREAWNMKFPGTYFAYASIMAIFGQSEEGIHVGLMLLNLATIFFVFLLGTRLAGKTAGTVSAVFYGFLSLSPGVLGFAAHATHFVNFFILAAFLVLLDALQRPGKWRFAIGGILFGTALIMKQSGVFFPMAALVLTAIYIYRKKTTAGKTDLFYLFGGCLTPFLLMLLFFVLSGDLDAFFHWTFQYAAAYGSQTSFADGIDNLILNMKTVLKGYGGFWIFVIAGFVSLFFLNREKHPHGRGFAMAILVAGLASVLPGLYFRPHYFITLLPGISLGAGILFSVAEDNLGHMQEGMRRLVMAAPLGGIVVVTLILQRNYFFFKKPAMLSREDMYSGDIFQDSRDIANYIRSRTKEGDEILVFGSEPQIFFYSGRKSAEGYIYTYPLMEEHPEAIQMQQDYAKTAEEKLPKYFLYCTAPTSWARQPHSADYIFTWAEGFLDKYYKQVGLAEIYADTTLYFWDQQLEDHQPPNSPDVALVHILQMRY